jgi:hypothetical protein
MQGLTRPYSGKVMICQRYQYFMKNENVKTLYFSQNNLAIDLFF